MIDKVFNAYKPLRNYLRKTEIMNALYVVWAYINYSQFDAFDLPQDVKLDRSLVANRNDPASSIHEWELTLLIREILVNGGLVAFDTVDLRQWSHMLNAVHKVREFENSIYPIYGTTGNVRKELRRIAHRQFPWQETIGSSMFVRYFKIYNNPRIRDITQKVLGVTVQQWYIMGTAILGTALTHTKFTLTHDISILNITETEFKKFLAFTSADLDFLQKKIKRDVNYDDEFVYELNPLEYYPLILLDGEYYCPVVNFLAWRITSGIYFDLVNDKLFGGPFGFAFQDYLEEVSRKILDAHITSVIPEAKYAVGKKIEDSVDLILSQSGTALFVEAKTKRMRSKSKSQLLSDEAMNRDLQILMEDVCKVYATIDDYLSGMYTHFKYSQSTKVYPILVTLEDWYMLGEDSEALLEMVKVRLQELKLSLEYVDKMPFTVCSTNDFEMLLQILNKFSMEVVMEKWNPLNQIHYNFGQFLRTEFKGEYGAIRDYFPEDFDL